MILSPQLTSTHPLAPSDCEAIVSRGRHIFSAPFVRSSFNKFRTSEGYLLSLSTLTLSGAKRCIEGSGRAEMADQDTIKRSFSLSMLYNLGGN